MQHLLSQKAPHIPIIALNVIKDPMTMIRIYMMLRMFPNAKPTICNVFKRENTSTGMMFILMAAPTTNRLKPCV